MYKQQGFLLVELLVVMALLLLMAVGSITWLQQRSTTLQVQTLSAWMQLAQKGLQAFIDAHASTLLQDDIANITIDGVADSRQPTLVELQQLGYLTASLVASSQATIRLYQEGACPGNTCYIHGVISSVQPLLNSKKQVDTYALAQWKMHTQGYGLAVTAAHPQWLSGSQLNIANSATYFGQVLKPGTVALWASAKNGSALPPEQHVMQPDFQSDVLTTGSVRAEQDVIALRDVIAGRDVKSGRDAHIANDLNVGGHFFLSPSATPETSCTEEGAISRVKDQAGLLFCMDGYWQLSQNTTLSNEVINQVFTEVFDNKTGAGFWGDWLSKGGYLTSFFSDVLNYTYSMCVIPNEKNQQQCECARYDKPVLASSSTAYGHSGSYTVLEFYTCTG